MFWLIEFIYFAGKYIQYKVIITKRRHFLSLNTLFGFIMLLFLFFKVKLIMLMHESSQNLNLSNNCLIKLFHLLPALLTLSHVSLLLLLCGFVSVIHLVCPFVWLHYFLTRADLWAGLATFQCSDTVVFVFVFAIPVCLDPCDPVDCGNSVPPCHSEPVWRNDLVSRTQTDQRNPPCCLWLSLHMCCCEVCSHCCGALHTGFWSLSNATESDPMQQLI